MKPEGERRMRRWFVLLWALVFTASTAVADPAVTGSRSVDLRDPAALAELQRTRPAHFATIRQILAALQEQPQRAEGDWLQATFDARDVDLSRLLLKTSHPPRQLLRFTLEDTRYTLHVTRSDLVAQPTVLR
jgi:hypothetical protein